MARNPPKKLQMGVQVFSVRRRRRRRHRRHALKSAGVVGVVVRWSLMGHAAAPSQNRGTPTPCLKNAPGNSGDNMGDCARAHRAWWFGPDVTTRSPQARTSLAAAAEQQKPRRRGRAGLRPDESIRVKGCARGCGRTVYQPRRGNGSVVSHSPLNSGNTLTHPIP